MNFYPPKQLSKEEKEKRVKILKTVYDTLKDASMSEDKKAEILFGALLSIGLTKNDVENIVFSKYLPGQ